MSVFAVGFPLPEKPSLVCSITLIVGCGTQEKMFWVDAGWIIAVVANQ
jgi:hypothetical protein